MPVPKQRHNSSRGKRRRSGHKKMTAVKLVKCPNCARMITPHQACPGCGQYKGRKY